LTVSISALIIYSGGTTGISHLKKHDLDDALLKFWKGGELEVFWSGVKK